MTLLPPGAHEAEEKRVHVFTADTPEWFLRHGPGRQAFLNGMSFTFGMRVPKNVDLLIVYSVTKYTIPCNLPRHRIVYIATEPEDIRPQYAPFLNQFGLVSTTSDLELNVPKRRENYCSPWYVGVNMGQIPYIQITKDNDDFSALQYGEKSDGIAIITSRRGTTELHHKREELIRHLVAHFKDRVHLFGSNWRFVDDKFDALYPFKYHVALENSARDYTWTEKLSDPLLCWSYPFHVGCANPGADLPLGAFTSIDVNDPQGAIRCIEEAIAEDRWTKALPQIAKARERILQSQNLMGLLASISEDALTRSASMKACTQSTTLILSEKHLRAGYDAADPNARYGRLILGSNLRLALVRLRKSSLFRGVTNPLQWAKIKLRLAAQTCITKLRRRSP